jgi:uncharacterized membrane protein YdjX (TVP38/TMEM64 family)
VIRRLLIVVGLAATLGLAVIFGPDIVVAASDPQQIRAVILSFGPLAPLGLIGLGVLQIVVAPIPGYVVQMAGGYLFGPVMGSVYGVIGMLLGAAIAFLLARRFGVPLVELVMPPRLLENWLHLRHVDSNLALFVMLVLPLGDFVYFLLGLTAVSLGRMLLMTLLVRTPSVLIAAFIGAEVGAVPRRLFALAVALVLIAAVVVAWQKARIEDFVYDRVLPRFLGRRRTENEQHSNDGDH